MLAVKPTLALKIAVHASHQERSPGIDLVMPLHLRRPPIPTELSIEVAIAKEGRLTSPIARKNQGNWIKSGHALQEKYAIREPKRWLQVRASPPRFCGIGLDGKSVHQ